MKRGTPNHIKTRRLMRCAGLDIIQACGALELLWHATARLTPRGEIGKYSDLEIEEEIGWRGEPGVLINGLIESGWVDRHLTHRLIVHDWQDHADDSVKKLLKRHGWEFVSSESDMSGHGLDMDPLPNPVPKPLPNPLPEPNPNPGVITDADQDNETLAYELANDLHATHPGLCSLPKARISAARALYRFRGQDLRLIVRGMRETHSAHCGIWKSLLADNPRAYVPHLHIWFEEEQYLQKDIRPRNRGQPSDKKQAAREQFDRLVMRDLEDANQQKIHSR